MLPELHLTLLGGFYLAVTAFCGCSPYSRMGFVFMKVTKYWETRRMKGLTHKSSISYTNQIVWFIEVFYR